MHSIVRACVSAVIVLFLTGCGEVHLPITLDSFGRDSAVEDNGRNDTEDASHLDLLFPDDGVSDSTTYQDTSDETPPQDSDAGVDTDSQPPADGLSDPGTDDDLPADEIDTIDAAECVNSCSDMSLRECHGSGYRECGDFDGDKCLEWSADIACPSGAECVSGICVGPCDESICTGVGQTSCDLANSVVTCGYYGENNCLNWGNPVSCGALVCSDGACASSCTDSCSGVGARKCEGNSVFSCADHDSDGCLEWGVSVNCGTATCSGGICTDSCKSSCTAQGSRKCDGNGFVTCGDFNGDGCFEWSSVSYCGLGTVCSNGSCGSACENECTVPNSRKCELNSVVVCGDYNDDGCLQWGSPLPCENGRYCLGGQCVESCQNTCAPVGLKSCDDGGNVVECGDYDGSGCLEWGTPIPCPGNMACVSGLCSAVCSPQCGPAGQRECVLGAKYQYRICGDFNNDGCEEWSSPVECPQGKKCQDASCVPDCSDECQDIGTKSCDSDTSWSVCGDHDGDGCLELGSSTSCGLGEVCVEGTCKVLCSDLCPVSGKKGCDGNSVVTCGDYNDDGCIEWGGASDCGTLTCKDGFCGIVCSDECSGIGTHECFGKGYRVCGEYDGDGCLEWGTVTDCPLSQVCTEGFCSQTCTSTCTVNGARKCDQNAVVTCGDYNSDGCTEWGNPVGCDSGTTCSGGACVIACVDSCTTFGARKCESNAVVTCGDHNNDGCLEWGNSSDCGALTCSGGFCSVVCENECTAVNSRKCDGNGFVICGDGDGDGCLEWGTVSNCGTSETCSNGYCNVVCSNECTVSGARKCELNSVVTCGDFNTDGCLEWGSPMACSAGMTCSGGVCLQVCQSECTVAGARSCDAGGNVITCGQYDSDDCLEWGTPQPCVDGKVCSGGGCVFECTDQCSAAGTNQCVIGSTTQYQTCGDFNDDGCLEWGSAVECTVGTVCSGGICAAACQSTCSTLDQLKCVTTGSWTRCGDYNGDSCLEWGNTVVCNSWEACQGGVCVALEPPATIKIDEVRPAFSGATNDSFVEIFGKAGTSLTGYRLVGIKGSSGSEYGIIELSGTIPSDGIFVVAHSGASENLKAASDMLDNNVDYDDTLTSVQLRFGAIVMDSVGWGNFGTADHFAGEGTPSSTPIVGSSLARDEHHTDTDNNKADFIHKNLPTPGAVTDNHELPVAALACPTVLLVGAPGAFDTSASVAIGSQLTSYSFNFGDGTSVSGTNTIEQHAYQVSGDYLVTVVVTDVLGASDSATCSVSVSGSEVPVVTFVDMGAFPVVDAGSTMEISVEVAVKPGRTVDRVELSVPGLSMCLVDSAFPYHFKVDIPGATAHGPLNVTARAYDSSGASGSASTTIHVAGDAPVPSFAMAVTALNTIAVDASASTDDVTPAAELEVRWDWTNDGVWDTAWTKTKTAVYTYASPGTNMVRLEVRDWEGKTSTTAKPLVLNAVTHVGGVVTTSLWGGTVIIDSDVTIPAGSTVTILPGTQIKFAFVDAARDQMGDVGIMVNGALIAEGTMAEPIIFTADQTTQTYVRAWDNITIAGAGSHFTFVTVEKANFGIVAKAGLEVADSKFSDCTNGIVVDSGSDVVMIQRSEFDSCSQSGLYQLTGTAACYYSEFVRNGIHGVECTGGSLTVDHCLSDSNTTDGVHSSKCDVTLSNSSFSTNGENGAALLSGVFNVDGCTLSSNGGVGLELDSPASARVYRNSMQGNGAEGLVVTDNPTGEPDIIANYNNIFDNAKEGAALKVTVSLIAAGVANNYYATTYTSTSKWTPPAGTGSIWAKVTYTESDSGNKAKGYIAAGTKTLWETTVPVSGWVRLSSWTTGDIVAKFYDPDTATTGSLVVSAIAYEAPGATNYTTILTASGKVDLKHNYFGTFPGVYDKMLYPAKSNIDIEGFIGKPFDSTWSKGSYFGADVFDNVSVTWMGTVYVTGNVTFNNCTVNTMAGTKVVFVKVDQNSDSYPDSKVLLNDSVFRVFGTADDRVLFSSADSTGQSGGTDIAWDTIKTTGQSQFDAGYATFEYGRYGLQIYGGALNLTGVVVRNNDMYCVFTGSSPSISVQMTDVTLSGAVFTGFEHTSSGQAVLDGVTVSGQRSRGISSSGPLLIRNSVIEDVGGFESDYAVYSTQQLVMTNVKVRNNHGSGLVVVRAPTEISDCSFESNGLDGLRFSGSLTADHVLVKSNQGVGIKSTGPWNLTLTNSEITKNRSTGLQLIDGAAFQQTATVSGCNIFGNSTADGLTVDFPALEAWTTMAYAEGMLSGPTYNVPTGYRIAWFELGYMESSEVDTVTGGATLGTSKTVYASKTQARNYVDVGSSGTYSYVFPFVTDVSATDYGRMSVPCVINQALSSLYPKPRTEAVFAAADGTFDLRGNYWGDFPDITGRVIVTHPEITDETGALESAVSGVGPRPL